MITHGEYWWLRLHDGGMDWAHRAVGETVPRAVGACKDYADLPIPPGAVLAVFIPGVHVRIHKAQIPARNRKRFLDALPFALEDQLLSDAESCHFVPLARGGSDGDVPVAVVGHDYMAPLMEELKKRGWLPQLLVPDYLAIPSPSAGTWLLDIADKPLMLRFPDDTGGAVLAAETGPQPPGALLLALEQASSPPRVLKIRVSNRPQRELAGGWSPWLRPFNLEMEIYEDPHTRSAWMMRQPLPVTGNLLTGPYAVTGGRRLWSRRMLPAAGLTAALLLVLVIHWFVEGMDIRSEHSDLQQAVTSTYLKVFPDARNLEALRFRMEKELEILRNRHSSGNADFLAQLEQLAVHIGGSTNLRLEALDFDGSSISLEVSVPDYEALDRLQKQLASGATVNVETAELRGGRVYGRILVRSKV
jgi:general secretion pathway protein L